MPLNLAKDIVIRWDQPEPEHVSLLQQLGPLTVISPSASSTFSAACSTAGIAIAPPSVIEFAATEGLWPGIRRPPTVEGRGDETASASREPWVDSNGYRIGYLRALYPNRPAVLAYLPGRLEERGVPFDSLELALIEAWVAGGNYVLALETRYRQALLAKEPKALAAWQQLGRTSRWLQENIAFFRQPAMPVVTTLVDSGPATAEIGNLLYRRNASPLMASAAAPPSPNPSGCLALVAANLKQPDAKLAKKILAHAEAGTTVVVAAPEKQQWWRNASLRPVEKDADRDRFAVGKGQLIAYRKPIADPSEFALDVIDLVTHKHRAIRLWNAPAVIALATASPRSGERSVHLINYGSPIDTELQARVQGSFGKATLLRPDKPSITLPTAKRGTTTEVFVPELGRLGVLVFS